MRSSTANGLSLIEVVAGLALMGTLLTIVLVSSSQHLRQLKAAERKRQSVQMLDDFLASWSVNRFAPETIDEAVQRSGLAATGSFGTHGINEQSSGHPDGYQVELRRAMSPSFDSASIIRLTVSVDAGKPQRLQTAWAEVLVPE